MPEQFLILVVDDNASNRFTLKTLLAKLSDCVVVEAESGEQALLRTIEQKMHLILLDVQMPGMDGFETARHLQMTERTRHIPIIFITAVFRSEEFILHGYAIGAVDYLTKPLDDNLLLNRVRLYQRLYCHERELERRVAQLQQQQKELIAAREAADAANHAKSVFLANMSHELRTPLNAILGFAQLMEYDERIPEDEHHNLKTINRAGQHLLALINDVLEISRIEAGRLQIQNEIVELDDCLHTVEEMIRIRAQNKGLGFVVERCGSLPRFVRGDAPHLRQVLLNLLGNAVKFTGQGAVTLRLSADSEWIRFEVIDTGPGISPEDQIHIFQPFYQAESGLAQAEGTGLGLTISREFVRLMGGTLTVESTPGQGSSFAFSLPLPEFEAPVEMASPRLRIMGLASGQASVRTLVVEDNADNRELIVRLLRGAGFEVRAVADGRQAVQVFQEWLPELIWMDMRMPVMDGYAATQAIRSLPGGKLVKIVALTASAFHEDRDAMMATGCNDVLSKPLNADQVLQCAASLLDLQLSYMEQPATEAKSGLSRISGNRPEISAIDRAICAELAQAARLLDAEAIQAILKRLQAERPELTQLIADWANAYRFDAIIDYCEPPER